MKDKFWLRPDHPDTQPRLTDKMIDDTETHLGVKIPPPYIRLLKRLNGGIPKRAAHWFPKRDRSCGTYWSFTTLLGIPKVAKAEEFRYNTLADGRGMAIAWQLPVDLINFTCDQHESGYCLDYRECGPRGNPPVVFVDLAPFAKPSPKTEVINSLHVIWVAPTFATFVKELFSTNLQHAYGLVSKNKDVDKIISSVQDLLKLDPTETNYELQESPFQRGEIVFTGTHPRWKSFRGKSNPCTFILQRNMGEDRHRDFPDQPDCAWILMADIRPGQHKPLTEALRQLPFKSKPIHTPDVAKMRYMPGFGPHRLRR